MAAQEEEVEDHDDTAEDPVHTPLILRDGLHNRTPDKPSEKDVEISNLVMESISPGRRRISKSLKVENIENRKPSTIHSIRQTSFNTPFKDTPNLDIKEDASETSSKRRKRFVLKSSKANLVVSPCHSPRLIETRKRKLDDSVGTNE